MFKDGGKFGYYGYWVINFYKVDEYFVSDDLIVLDFMLVMYDVGFKVVFDIVVNYGMLSWIMLKD